MLSFALLFSGCYTHTPLTKESPPSTVEVAFRLNDGTYILSSEYQRIENGYKVVGKLVNKENKNSRDFSGIVSDEQIKEAVTNEFNKTKTVSAAVLSVSIFLVGVGLAIAESMSSH
jgi:hypothetical protein